MILKTSRCSPGSDESALELYPEASSLERRSKRCSLELDAEAEIGLERCSESSCIELSLIENRSSWLSSRGLAQMKPRAASNFQLQQEMDYTE